MNVLATPTRTPEDAAGAGDAAADVVTRTELRPRYEGSNICTWIGFKHVNYLVEEAVLDHLRQGGHRAGELYERHGLCVDLVNVTTRMLTAYHIDDVALATVRRLPADGPVMRFAVDLEVERDGKTIHAVAATAGVSFRSDPKHGPAEPAPAELAPYVVESLGAPREAVPVGNDPVEELTAGRNAYGWSWRVPYWYCHFTERVQMSGYLRLMEEAVDLFLADRGVSIKTLLDEQDWIPVVPQSEVTVLSEAGMEEELVTIFTVEKIFKDLTYRARMDCYARRPEGLVPTATGRITHGYALITSRRDWSVVNFDDRLAGALAARPAGRGAEHPAANAG